VERWLNVTDLFQIQQFDDLSNRGSGKRYENMNSNQLIEQLQRHCIPSLFERIFDEEFKNIYCLSRDNTIYLNTQLNDGPTSLTTIGFSQTPDGTYQLFHLFQHPARDLEELLKQATPNQSLAQTLKCPSPSDGNDSLQPRPAPATPGDRPTSTVTGKLGETLTFRCSHPAIKQDYTVKVHPISRKEK
jgi:hypothetical protein